MGGFDINKAARLIRAGDAFSGTNIKLREAAIFFVAWLFEKIGPFDLRGTANDADYGWILKEKGGHIRLDFKTECYGWHSVSTDKSECYINGILALCETLEGHGGAKLMEWIENEGMKRERHLNHLNEVLTIAKRI